MPRTRTIQVLDNLREYGATDAQILEYLLFNYLSGDEAKRAIEAAQEELIYNRNFSV